MVTTTSAGSEPAGFVSHIVDIENLCAGQVSEHCADVWKCYTDLVGVDANDQITVAANRNNALPAFFALPPTARRLLVPNEPDAADRALVDSVDVERIVRRHRAVVIASGDGYFAALARTLRGAGVEVIQVATRGVGISADLYVNCDELVTLPSLSPVRARLRGRTHLRVLSAARRATLSTMTTRSHTPSTPRQDGGDHPGTDDSPSRHDLADGESQTRINISLEARV